jgi:uncharacterized membrane protein (UPF0127 family)
MDAKKETKDFEKFSFDYLGKPLEIKAETCKGFWSQFIGKMFSRDKEPIIFEFNKLVLAGIHMLFVFMPLLVVWFDADKNVTKMRIMKPFTSFDKAYAKYVLEIPMGNKIIANFEQFED